MSNTKAAGRGKGAKLGALLSGAVLATVAAVATAGTIQLKVSETLSAGFPSVDALSEMVSRINAKPDGTLKMTFYPGGQLGNEKETTEQTQLGAIQMNRISVAVLGAIVDDVNVLSLPYLFRDVQHMEKFIDSPVGDELLDAITNKPNSRLVGLAWLGAGARSVFTTDKQVETVSDLEGLKIRIIANPLFSDTLAAMGASPVPLGWGDVFTGLQTGTLDGAESAPPTIVSASLQTITKYFTTTEHLIVPDVLVMSRRTWDRLSEEQREEIRVAVKQMKQRQRELWRVAEKKSLDTMREAGMQISTFQHKDELKKMTQGVRDKYGAKYQAWIDKIGRL